MLQLKNFRIRIFIIYFPKQKCCFKNFRKKFLNEFRTKNHRFRIRKSNLLLLVRSNTNKKRHQMCNNHKIILYYCQYNTQQIIVTSFAWYPYTSQKNISLKIICQKNISLNFLFPELTFVRNHICQNEHLPENTSARINICLKLHLPE